MSGLVLKSVSKSFGDRRVLDNVSLSVNDSELLVLLGPSGCGKSTLLRLVAGLEQLDSGDIHIGGLRVDQLRPRDRDVALVFQNYSLFPHMSVENNLAFPLKVARVKKSEIKARVHSTAQMLGLGDRLKDKPGKLSGGQRQRVALGRAIIRKPSLFLLDEPLSNLDADLRSRMRQEIVALQKRLGTTMIHVTHDQAEALTMADRIALLNQGRFEQVGTPRELYGDPQTVFVARTLGSPPINLLPGRVEGNMLQPFGLDADESGVDAHERNLLLGLRPDAVRIVNSSKWTGEVQSCEYLGGSFAVKLEFAGELLTVSGEKSALRPTSPASFIFARKDLLVFDADTGLRLSGSA
ncbi:MAG: ABC transporter ATP-binding protein [Candidatus Zixiibacteriota bacterium]